MALSYRDDGSPPNVRLLSASSSVVQARLAHLMRTGNLRTPCRASRSPSTAPGRSGSRPACVGAALDVHHCLEGGNEIVNLVERLAFDGLTHHRRGRLADRTSLTLDGHVGNAIAVQAKVEAAVRPRTGGCCPQRGRRGGRGFRDCGGCGCGRGSHPGRDLQSTRKTSCTLWRPARSASTSSLVLYTWNEARTVAGTPSARVSGLAQW